MDDLTPIAEANGGYLMRHQLNDLGLHDAAIRHAVRAGVLLRVRHGTYVVKAVWDLLSDSQRHATLTRSLLDKLGPNVVATHQSAAALHGFDLFGNDLGLIHVTRLDGHRGRREAGVVFHEGRLEDEQIVDVEGRQVVAPARAVFETCTLAGTEGGMVVATSAMRSGTVSREQLDEEARAFDHWPGTRVARLAIRLADPRLETVGEVRSLHLMWRHGIPHPELQWTVTADDGTVIARTDFAWVEARHTGEFDGMAKYGRLNPYVTDPGRTIEKEKVREDAVRGQLLGMTRWVWADLAPRHQGATAQRIRAGLAQSAKLYTRNARTIA
ncbi:type IV toxin-antitoxin system AbiEi family antitoxin domain-containing protein [Aeromicrobium stalagmiti]|uniref:type IV toxin-antitoxin system AbiEi family antitoxin domain-containing protein n=1 Tax=Aeromicrobium stalagmiti TaxID=2738988 RepID=UPI0015682AA2|nr:type IV toxin-antitoxin system AbiEi family antitoxin domain-containing protein [Aeromicrobium stalagmiti]NRQ51159.1 type IV toxin-antitoxin system AbiEi family antitoxin domain-containing protein [Aeromicrobium stalagmiti]